ncbi:hypothetical protein PTET_b0086 [Pseudoalteromonas tetraodonis]|nr:hypothetical protein PTET_b0086 [Pseudoalteromonas tetraodonis]
MCLPVSKRNQHKALTAEHKHPLNLFTLLTCIALKNLTNQMASKILIY